MGLRQVSAMEDPFDMEDLSNKGNKWTIQYTARCNPWIREDKSQ